MNLRISLLEIESQRETHLTLSQRPSRKIENSLCVCDGVVGSFPPRATRQPRSNNNYYDYFFFLEWRPVRNDGGHAEGVWTECRNFHDADTNGYGPVLPLGISNTPNSTKDGWDVTGTIGTMAASFLSTIPKWTTLFGLRYYQSEIQRQATSTGIGLGGGKIWIESCRVYLLDGSCPRTRISRGGRVLERGAGRSTDGSSAEQRNKSQTGAVMRKVLHYGYVFDYQTAEFPSILTLELLDFVVRDWKSEGDSFISQYFVPNCRMNT